MSEDLVGKYRIMSVNENDVIISKSLICFCVRPQGGPMNMVRIIIGSLGPLGGRFLVNERLWWFFLEPCSAKIILVFFKRRK